LLQFNFLFSDTDEFEFERWFSGVDQRHLAQGGLRWWCQENRLTFYL